MHHPEQPALARVRDIAGGIEAAGRGDAGIAGRPDQRVHIVGQPRIGDQVRGCRREAREAEAGERRDVLPRAAEAGAAKEMLDVLFPSEGHARLLSRG